MSDDHRDVLEILRCALNSLEQGGYGLAKEDGRLLSPFCDAQICPNFDDPLRPHACRECFLFDLVPEDARTANVPCHYIPLDPAGHRMFDFLKAGDAAGLERALKIWIRRTLGELAQGELRSVSR
ncbi:MAG TPA: hypothetical protein VFU86_07195 [Terriglobales bacterium]|nr:hypothetical protein [Terriglobales bacterium]